MQEQDLRCTAAATLWEKARPQDAGIVGDEQIAGPQQRGQVRESAMLVDDGMRQP